MSKKSAPDRCFIREGRFVEPCETLASLIDGAATFSKAKGIRRWEYVNVKERKPSRSMIGVKTASYPNGFLFSFCPCCGADISAPFDVPNEATRKHLIAEFSEAELAE